MTQFAAHQENRRLIGFVIHLSETLGEESMSAYVFESNTEGEKVCVTFNKILHLENRSVASWLTHLGNRAIETRAAQFLAKKTCVNMQTFTDLCLKRTK